MRWLARGEAGIPEGTDWLHEREAARAAEMRFTKRRTEYLLRRYVGKAAVAAVLGIPEAELGRIAVLNHPTGAPYVQVDGSAVGLEISLSDRAGWAVCLVGERLGDVGIDVEIAEPRTAGFIRDYLTPAEQEFVLGLAAGAPRDAATNLVWSAKEAALKVLRTGLRADTRTVEIAIQGWGEVGGVAVPSETRGGETVAVEAGAGAGGGGGGGGVAGSRQTRGGVAGSRQTR
ncbi:MAG: 4'-phosphopantetheinyl transferase family protein, partial [Candidatus Nanopelagicales bacterium]